jgi:hypothetical protein
MMFRGSVTKLAALSQGARRSVAAPFVVQETMPTEVPIARPSSRSAGIKTPRAEIVLAITIPW